MLGKETTNIHNTYAHTNVVVSRFLSAVFDAYWKSGLKLEGLAAT